MAIAFARPFHQGFACDVSSFSYACNTENTAKCSSSSSQVTQKSSCTRLMKRSTVTAFNRAYSSTVLSNTSRLKKIQKIGGEESLKPYLIMAIQCLHATRNDDLLFQSGKDFAINVERQIVHGKDSSQGQSTDSKVLDQWLRDAVFEIVRHLHEAPFIHFVFDPENRRQKPERQNISKGFFMRPDLWTFMRSSILQSSPLGLILVQKLDKQWLSQLSLVEKKHSTQISLPSDWTKADESSTDIWGILVEGKGIVWNSCYILKTTRVASCTGTCTHFCMAKAKCFGPSLQEQLEKMWLL